MDTLLEIRTYKLKPGAGPKLDRIFREGALPMLRRHGIHVVGFGASKLDPDTYFLSRSYESLESRGAALDRFYGSEEWIATFDADVMALIDTYHTVLIDADHPFAANVAALAAGRTPTP